MTSPDAPGLYRFTYPQGGGPLTLRVRASPSGSEGRWMALNTSGGMGSHGWRSAAEYAGTWEKIPDEEGGG